MTDVSIEQWISVSNGPFKETGRKITKVSVAFLQAQGFWADITGYRSILCCTWGGSGAAIYEGSSGYFGTTDAHTESNSPVVE